MKTIRIECSTVLQPFDFSLNYWKLVEAIRNKVHTRFEVQPSRTKHLNLLFPQQITPVHIKEKNYGSLRPKKLNYNAQKNLFIHNAKWRERKKKLYSTRGVLEYVIHMQKQETIMHSTKQEL